jgi:hypothetical protein
MTRRATLGALLAGTACPGESFDPVFPADYADTYVEVRDCRASADHGLQNVLILADPLALEPYQNRAEPFPEGAVVLKELYDLGDTACEGELRGWAAMRKLADDEAPDLLDWEWQRLEVDRSVVEQDAPRCVACHEHCGEPPGEVGYAGTCADP